MTQLIRGDGYFERRLRRLVVAPEAILSLTRGVFRVVANPLPEDAYIVASNFSGQRNVFEVVVASESFEPVAVGAVIPEHPAPMVARVRKKQAANQADDE